MSLARTACYALWPVGATKLVSSKPADSPTLGAALCAKMVALRRSSRIAAGAKPSPPKVVDSLTRRRGQKATRAKHLKASEQANAKLQNGLEGGRAPNSKRESTNTKAARLAKTKPKTGPTKALEMRLWSKGCLLIAGTDEAGRGPLAGPVVAAACCIPQDVTIEGVADSKKMTEAQREAVYTELTSHPRITWATHVVDAKAIDEINILQAAMLAMETSVSKLQKKPDFVLVDGNRLPKGLPPDSSRAVIKGDDSCYCIAAASVIAKVTRDRMMLEYDAKWPQYDFKNNKGYGTAKHMTAIREHGATDIHRRTFAPLKHMNL